MIALRGLCRCCIGNSVWIGRKFFLKEALLFNWKKYCHDNDDSTEKHLNDYDNIKIERVFILKKIHSHNLSTNPLITFLV